jgi:hypothetical protein
MTLLQELPCADVSLVAGEASHSSRSDQKLVYCRDRLRPQHEEKNMKPFLRRAVGSRVRVHSHLNAVPAKATAYRLTPDVIQSIVPSQRIGTYVLIKDGVVSYVGRSDTDIQRRLLAHYAVTRADYFRFQLHTTVEQACVAECAAYHALKNQLTNIAHPAQPNGLAIACAFCSTEVRAILTARRLARRTFKTNLAFITNLGKGAL